MKNSFSLSNTGLGSRQEISYPYTFNLVYTVFIKQIVNKLFLNSKMNTSLSAWIISIFLVVLCLFSCQSEISKTSRVDKLPYYQDALFTPHWFEDAPPSDFHKIPPFQLINQEGDTIGLATLKNKIYVADFFFTTCPGICPKMQKNMTILHDKYLEDDALLLLSHTVMPRYDSVAVLKQYAEDRAIRSSKWHILTGVREHIYDLGRNYYFAEEDLGLEKEADDFLHTENFLLIDQNKHIRGIYNGLNKTAIQQLIADIELLKKE